MLFKEKRIGQKERGKREGRSEREGNERGEKEGEVNLEGQKEREKERLQRPKTWNFSPRKMSC